MHQFHSAGSGYAGSLVSGTHIDRRVQRLACRKPLEIFNPHVPAQMKVVVRVICVVRCHQQILCGQTTAWMYDNHQKRVSASACPREERCCGRYGM